jgi:hypothetical protein
MKWTALAILSLTAAVGGCEGKISAPGLSFKNFRDSEGNGEWKLAPNGRAINAYVSFDAFKRAAGSPPDLQCACRVVPINISLNNDLWRATAGASTRPAGNFLGLAVSAIAREGEPVRGVFLELPAPINGYIFCANAGGILPLDEKRIGGAVCVLNEKIGPWHVSALMGADQVGSWKTWSEALQGAILSRVTD